MKNKILAVDVDLTVVDSAFHWWKWLEEKTNAGLSYDLVSRYYDFTIPYAPLWASMGLSGTPLDFWRGEHVYDQMTPLEGSVEALMNIKKLGWNICFVSALKGLHHKSKYEFLERNFPFMDGFAGTKEKWMVNADAIIDDRNRFLNMFNSDIIRIKKITPHDQDVGLIGGCLEFNDWNTLGEYSGRIFC